MPLIQCDTCGAVQWRTNLGWSMRCFDCGMPAKVVPRSEASRVLEDTAVPTGELVKQEKRRRFYCQNPAQSGDTTGVGVALLLFPERSLLFIISANEVAKAEGYLAFYHGLGISPQRIVLAIGDVGTEERSDDEEVLRKQHSEESEFSSRIASSSKAHDDNRLKAMRMRVTPVSPFQGLHPATPPKALGYVPLDHEGAFAQQRYDELDKLGKLAGKRKIQAATLLEKRMGLTKQLTVNREKRILDAFTQAEKCLSKMVSTVVLWEHLTERGGNQMYQDLLNPGVRLTKGSSTTRSYETTFGKSGNQYSDIGQTTRDTAQLVATQGICKVASTVCTQMDHYAYPTVDTFANDFIETLLKEQPSLRFSPKSSTSTGGLKPTILLIWVRGLNGSEAKSIQESGIGSKAICDDLQTRLDGYKRNPHHVMTAQLYETLRLVAKLINNRKEYSSVNSKRWLIPVAIGDCVKLDWYDIGASESKNLYEGPTATNLIQFFTRVPAFKGDRVSQMYFLRQLTKRIDTIQIGIRSGAMEQGMYMGVPTIYLEEQDSPSGERMASLATDVLPTSNLTNAVMLNPKKFGMFFRLKTKHLIGLNQGRSLPEVEEIKSWVVQRDTGDLSIRAAKGTLTRFEIDSLLECVAKICDKMGPYHAMLNEK